MVVYMLSRPFHRLRKEGLRFEAVLGILEKLGLKIKIKKKIKLEKKKARLHLGGRAPA